MVPLKIAMFGANKVINNKFELYCGKDSNLKKMDRRPTRIT